jgi:hypothetical protein
VEKGQLSNSKLFNDRLKLYRSTYGLGPTDGDESEDEAEAPEKPIFDDFAAAPSEIESELSTKISEIKELLEDKQLNKNQKKTYRKKLKKFEDKLKTESEIKAKKAVPVKVEKKVETEPVPKKKKKTAKELFSAFDTKLVLTKGPKLEKGFKVKIADLGNACW